MAQASAGHCIVLMTRDLPDCPRLLAVFLSHVSCCRDASQRSTCLACAWHVLGMPKATQLKQAEDLLSAFWAQPCPQALTDAAGPSCWLHGLGRLFLDLKGAGPREPVELLSERFFLSESSHGRVRRQRAGTGQGGLVGWVPLQVRVSQQAECP